MTVSDYPQNVNLRIPSWLHKVNVSFTFFNLCLAVFTIIFQIQNPNSKKNMGRFFSLILVLQTLSRANLFFQEIFFQDLSVPFYELKYEIRPRSTDTQLCQYFGFIRTFFNYLSQFYCLWIAVLIKQILKDPIHRVSRFIVIYHVITILVSLALTFILLIFSEFGVEETLQCGLMTTYGFDDESLVFLTYIVWPIQIYLIIRIMIQTPYIVRVSLKKFVAKYAFYIFFSASIHAIQMALLFMGATHEDFFSEDKVDGYMGLRIAFLIGDHLTFFCLSICTLCENVFYRKCFVFYNRYVLKRGDKKKKQDLLLDQDRRNEAQIELQNLKSPNNVDEYSSDEDFEQGNNKITKKDEIDVEDQQKLEHIIDADDDENTSRDSMNLQQKTNFFIINAVLMSLCNCIINQKKQSRHNALGVMSGLVKFAKKVITYDLRDQDINHIIDLAKFFKEHEDICVQDVANGNEVQVKITEFGPEMMRNIRKQSGYNDDFLIKSFSPKENEVEMSKFQEGSGKSASFFFFTSNKQFVIKTLKNEELDLLARKGVLEKYYNHIHKNKRSLLARYYGIFTVKVKYMKPINVIVMDNIIGPYADEAMRVYDLKGSTFKRITNDPEGPRSVRKDLNFLDDSQFRMRVSPEMQKDLLQRMIKDKDFLKQCNLMDYSLFLIFFEKKENALEEEKKNSLEESQISEEDDEYDENQFSQQQKKAKTKQRQMSAFPGVGNFGSLLLHKGRDSRPKDPLINTPVKEKNAYELSGKNNGAQENSNEAKATPKDSEQKRVSNLTDGRNSQTPKLPLKKTTSQMFKNVLYLKKITGTLSNDANNPKELKPRTKRFIQYKCADDEKIYYRLGIIDFLQDYNHRKQIENKWLILRNRDVDPNLFSCVPPKAYAERFYEFMSKNLFKSQVGAQNNNE